MHNGQSESSAQLDYEVLWGGHGPVYVWGQSVVDIKIPNAFSQRFTTVKIKVKGM